MFRDGQIPLELMMPAELAGKGYPLNNTNIAAAPAAVKLRERDQAVVRPPENRKIYPCLLTRRELQELIAEQLG